jgi:hypothetical protein
MRSLQARGKSGSRSGQRTVVGTEICSLGSGGTSARLVATVPDPARDQPIKGSERARRFIELDEPLQSGFGVAVRAS